jgi:hypothetical protein
MGVIMIRCPHTREAFSTGIETDPLSFRRLPDTVVHAHCPCCGSEHAWSKRDAWLAEIGASQLRTA